MSYLEGFSPLGQALLATLFTWAVTALGASLVLLTPRVEQRLLDAMNGFAAGPSRAVLHGASAGDGRRPAAATPAPAELDPVMAVPVR
jgi:ZIP family zinc transporter